MNWVTVDVPDPLVVRTVKGRGNLRVGDPAFLRCWTPKIGPTATVFLQWVVPIRAPWPTPQTWPLADLGHRLGVNGAGRLAKAIERAHNFGVVTVKDARLWVPMFVPETLLPGERVVPDGP